VSSDPAAAVVTTTVTNAGTTAGRDVVQLYLSPPGGTRKLATFGKTPQLEAGASHTLTLSIDKREFESWNGSGWEIAPGKWTVSLCRNARDVEWTAEIAL
jgi:beta-glucosidase